jgi:hypothetical protein
LSRIKKKKRQKRKKKKTSTKQNSSFGTVQLLWVIVERNQETQKGHYLSVMTGLLQCFQKKLENKSFFSKSDFLSFIRHPKQ